MTTTMLNMMTAPPMYIVQFGSRAAANPAVVSHAQVNPEVAITKRASGDTLGLATAAASANTTTALTSAAERTIDDVMAAAPLPDPAHTTWRSSVLPRACRPLFDRSPPPGWDRGPSVSTVLISQDTARTENLPGTNRAARDPSPRTPGRSSGAASIGQPGSGRIACPLRRLRETPAIGDGGRDGDSSLPLPLRFPSREEAWQWSFEQCADYRAFRTVGTLFLLNAIASAIVGIALLVPIRRVAAGRTTDAAIGLLALAAVAIAVGSLVALFISESCGLLGFTESGYRAPIVVAISAEAATIALLGPVAAVSLAGAAQRPANTATYGRTARGSRPDYGAAK